MVKDHDTITYDASTALVQSSLIVSRKYNVRTQGPRLEKIIETPIHTSHVCGSIWHIQCMYTEHKTPLISPVQLTNTAQ